MQATGQRRPSLTNTSRPSSRSGIPRPTLRTTFDGPQQNGNGDQSATSTTEPTGFFQQRQRPRDEQTSPSYSNEPTSLSFDQATIRSPIGPALQSTRSSPAIASPAERLRKPSFKDLVAKFDQSPSNETSPQPSWKSPRSGSRTRKAAGTEQMQTPVDDRSTHGKRNRRVTDHGPPTQDPHRYQTGGLSLKTSRSASEQVPQPASAIAPPTQGLLFGELGTDDRVRTGPGHGIPRDRQRRGSEGSMHHPNAMFPVTRENTAPGVDPPLGMRSGFSASSSNLPSTHSPHQRSISDNASSHASMYASPGHSVESQANGPASPSRIPIRHRQDVDYLGQGVYDPKNTSRRPATPPNTSTSHSHRHSPNKTPGSGQPRLRAIINAPAPKISPPLRSSRPRQQVSSARSVSTEGQDRKRYPAIGNPVEKPHLRGVSNAEFATRRESIRRALKQTEPQPSVEVPGLSTSAEEESQEDSSTTPSADTITADPSNASRNLTVNVNDLKPPENEPVSGGTQFEDDSPVSVMPGSFPEFDSDTNDSAKKSTVAGQTDHKSRTVYSTMMAERKRPTTYTSQYSGITGRASPTPEREDAGTIQIMLGETPILDRLEQGWDNETPTNKADRDNYFPGHLSIKAGSGNLSSNLTPSSTRSRSGRVTLDSDAYSMINRVIDQYRESGVVTSDMVYEFQQHILETDPDFSQRDDIDSMMVAKAALEELIRDNTLENIASGPRVSSNATSTSFNFDSSDPFPMDMDGGAAALASLSANEWEEEEEEEQERRSRSHGRNASELTDASSYAASFANEAEGNETSLQPPRKDSELISPRMTRDASAQREHSAASDADVSSSLEESGPQLPELPKMDQSFGIAVGANAESTERDSSNQPRTSSTNQAGTTNASFPLSHETTASSSTNEGEPRGSESSTVTDARRLTQRRHLIKELVDTEFSFNQDMKVIEDIYKGTATAVEALAVEDRKVLFGNSAQIVEFSEEFLDSLKQAASSVYVMPRVNKWRVKQGSFSTSNSGHTNQSSSAGAENADEEKDRGTTIGGAFESHMSRMERVYSEYLKNHDYANQRLSKLQNIPQVRLWLNECHTYAEDITTAWDLDSLLVKPVQRILKYPLLLKSLMEVTPHDHPDYASLEVACRQMTEVSHRINESKKRAELLDQVVNNRNGKRKEFDATLGLSKAFGRRTEKLRQQVGLSDAVEDPEYQAIAERFGGHVFQLQVVMRDFDAYRKATSDFVRQFNAYVEALEAMIDVGHSQVPEIESKWRKFALMIREMTAIAYADHDTAIRKHCINPIVAVLKLHASPERLLQKRKKRIVDYARYMAIKSRGDKVDKKTAEQGEQFIALNDTLKDELPKLYQLTAKLVLSCLHNFVDILAQWHTTWQKKIKNILDEQEPPKDYEEIVEAFKSDYAVIEAQILSLGLCNGSALAEAANFLSYPGSFGADDSSSTTINTARQRNVLTKSRGTSINSEKSPSLQDYYKRRSSGSFHQFDSRTSLEQQQPWPNGFAQNRLRAASTISTRSNPGTLVPPTPRSNTASAAYNPPAEAYPQLPSSYSADVVPRLSTDDSSGSRTLQRPLSSSTAYFSAPGGGGAALVSQPSTTNSTPNIPQLSVFSSALPLSDSPSESQAITPVSNDASSRPSRQPESAAEPKVLFVVASAFEFNIDRSRTTAGYPYLTYVPGEIFDVIGENGELWLAKNQDDKTNTIGWIWEKHFWRVPGDETDADH